MGTYRNRELLDQVKQNDCMRCGQPADDPNHLISSWTKAFGKTGPDWCAYPLCRACHNLYHSQPTEYRRLGDPRDHLIKWLARLFSTEEGCDIFNKGKIE